MHSQDLHPGAPASTCPPCYAIVPLDKALNGIVFIFE